MQALFASQPRAYWEALLDPAECCFQAILEYDELENHPHHRVRGSLQRRGRFKEVLFPVLVDEQPPQARTAVRDASLADVLAAWKKR